MTKGKTSRKPERGSESKALSTVSAKAGAKLLLFGEHAAVYGHPALGMGLPLYTEVEIHFASEKRWRIPNLDARHHGVVHEAIERAESVLVHRDKTSLSDLRGTFRFESDVPLASGYGSSASLAVALYRALAMRGFELLPEFNPNNRPPEWKAANLIEETFHGTPSGIDAGLCSLGGLIEFRGAANGTLPEARTLSPRDFCILASSVPRLSSTRELIAMLRRRIEDRDDSVVTKLKRLGDIAATAGALFTESISSMHFLEQLGEAADEAHTLLGELGLGHPRIDQAIRSAKSAGAFGGKVSGAGGGGAFYAVCENEDSVRAVHRAVQVHLADQPLFAFRVGDSGVSRISL